MDWEDFFAQLQIPRAVYMTFFPNDETQILFLGFDDTPPILYHWQELINIDLLSTLPWENINNLKYKYIYNSVYPDWCIFNYMWMWTGLKHSGTHDCIVFFVVFGIYAFWVHILLYYCSSLHLFFIFVFHLAVQASGGSRGGGRGPCPPLLQTSDNFLMCHLLH